MQALLTGYATLGTVFAVAFLARGLAALDPAARGSGAAFRAALIPGVIALWPYLLIRWLRTR